jgi:divalent metal cation (Fe/Co/Zn/Cd) transporter
MADVVVGVPSELTVEQAHAITERVREELLMCLPRDVRAHVGFRPVDEPTKAARRAGRARLRAATT